MINVCATILTIVMLGFLSIGNVFSQSLTPDGGGVTAPVSGSTEIAVDGAVVDDADIEKRLVLIFSEIDELKDISVNVSNSVVQLSGQAESSGSSTEAQQLATSLEGVVKVENQIVVSRDVTQRVRSTWSRVAELVQQIAVALPLALLAFIVIVVFWYLAGFLAGQIRLWRKLAPNMFIASVIGSIVRLAVLLAGVILGLYLLDATSIIATMLGAAGIVGLALGFAVRDTVENFISSILLSVRQPFRTNDLVQINEYLGSVARLTGRDTVLISPDGNQIRIPNSVVFKSVITNYTRHQMRRFKLTVPVDESENLGIAKRTAEQALQSVKGIQTEPAPQVHIEALGETVISLSVFGWVDQQTHDHMKVKTACAVAIKTAFRSAGIVMPESIHTLKIVNAKKEVIPLVEDSVSVDGAATQVGQSEARVSLNTPIEILDTSIAADDTLVITTQLAEEQNGAQNLLDS